MVRAFFLSDCSPFCQLWIFFGGFGLFLYSFNVSVPQVSIILSGPVRTCSCYGVDRMTKGVAVFQRSGCRRGPRIKTWSATCLSHPYNLFFCFDCALALFFIRSMKSSQIQTTCSMFKIHLDTVWALKLLGIFPTARFCREGRFSWPFKAGCASRVRLCAIQQNCEKGSDLSPRSKIASDWRLAILPI